MTLQPFAKYTTGNNSCAKLIGNQVRELIPATRFFFGGFSFPLRMLFITYIVIMSSGRRSSSAIRTGTNDIRTHANGSYVELAPRGRGFRPSV